MYNKHQLAYFIERNPSLVSPIEVYSILEGVQADFIAHINSHGSKEQRQDYCKFCVILNREESNGN